MPILTAEDVREEAGTSSIDLSGYTDDMINSKVEVIQADIELQTGRVFGAESFTETYTQMKGDRIFLKKKPVQSIDLLSINDSYQIIEDYIIDLRLGIIYLDSTYIYPFDVMIQYTAGEDSNSKAYKVARDLIIDIFFLNIDKGDRREASSFRDGDTSINYKDPAEEINNRIRRLKLFRVRSC